MSPRRSVCLALAALLWTFIWSSPARGHAPWVTNYLEDDGLPSSWVSDLTQGADGRMWFLTEGGVAAYDGVAWKTYPLEDGRPLRGGFRFALNGDGEGGWALCQDGNLFRFDGAVWSIAASSPFDPARTTLTDFAVLDTDGGSVPVLATLAQGLFFFEGGEYTHLEPAGKLPFRTVFTLHAAGRELLVGTERGLWSWRAGSLAQRFVPPNALSGDVRGLASEPAAQEDERILLSGEDWIGRLEEDRFEIIGRIEPKRAWLRYHRVVLASDRKGGIFFGNAGGIYRLDPGSGNVEAMQREQGVAGSGVLAFHSDRERNLWIATAVGVTKVPALPFENLDIADGLGDDEVTAVAELASGSIVFGHNRGLTFHSDGARQTVALPAGEVPRVLDLERDSQDRLWVAGSGLGLLRVGTDRRVEHLAGGGSDPHDWVSSARFDAEGRLWVGGPGGLFLWDGDGLVPVETPIPDLRGVRRIFLGADGSVYVATGSLGLLIRTGSGWIQARHRGASGGNNIFALHEMGDGRVLVGTRAGLLELVDDTLVWPRAGDLREIVRPVYFLVEDTADDLWIGTNFGVFRWQPGKELRRFGLGEGLAGLETNRAAGFVDTRGRVWIGTDRGVSFLTGEFDPGQTPPPPVELLAADGRGESFDPSLSWKLAQDRNDLTFRVRAISFLDERKMEFRSRLEGLSDEWTRHQGVPTILDLHYPRLPPGRYQLEVQACSLDSRWSPIARSGIVEITPPFWWNRWFLGLVGISIALSALGVQSVVSQRRYARRLERDVARQTTELTLSRREIEAEKERLAAVLASIGDGVVALDGNGMVDLVNPAAERMLGLPADRDEGEPLSRLLARREDRVAVALRRWLRRPDGLEAARRRPVTLGVVGSGEGVLELAVARYRPAGREGRGTVLAFRDISERFRAEEERARARRLEALGVLAGGIAHDFNNILTAVLGNISLVRAGGRVDALDETRLEDAENALDRAHRLARQLVTFGRGGAPVTAPVSIADLVEQTARFVYSGSAVGFSIDLAHDLPAVEADSDQVQQVFENLFLNARQAMGDRGNVVVSGEVTMVPAGSDDPLEPGRYLRVDVHDQGGGIGSDELDRVFEPYYSTKTGGSGLGLATSYSIVRRHGGNLTVRSTGDEGTVFSVFLPVSTRPLPVEERHESAVRDRGRARVLVLDDEPAVAAVLRDMLTTLGHDVEITASGDQTLETCRRAVTEDRRFEVAILDLTIPGGRGGAEIVRGLHEIDTELRSIASSGYSDSPVLARFRSHGFCGVLRKPYRIDSVAEKVDEALGSRRQGRDSASSTGRRAGSRRDRLHTE